MNESNTHARNFKKLNCKGFIRLVSFYVTFWTTENSSWPGTGGGVSGLATRGHEGTFCDVINVLYLGHGDGYMSEVICQNCRTVYLKG